MGGHAIAKVMTEIVIIFAVNDRGDCYSTFFGANTLKV